MAFLWTAGWDDKDNNNGATQEEITTILSKAKMFGSGDSGLLQALADASGTVTIEKGIHQDNDPHIRVFYLGGTWHVNMVQTATGGRAGYRVGKVSQFQ